MTQWPTHSDGTNKRVGDMTTTERAAVMQAAKQRFFNQAAPKPEKISKRARKAARKLLQRPYNFAAQYRGDLFAYLDMVAKHRNPMMSPRLVREYCNGFHTAAVACGFYLP